MINNIDKVLDRGRKIDDILVETDNMVSLSQDFRYSSRTLKRTLCWRNVVLILILIFILLVIFGIVVWFICGFPVFQNCRAWFSPPPSS